MARHAERSLPQVSTWKDMLSNITEEMLHWSVGLTTALMSSTACRPSKPIRKNNMVQTPASVSFALQSCHLYGNRVGNRVDFICLCLEYCR